MNPDAKLIPKSITILIDLVAENIARTTPFQAWDECVERLCNRLADEADKRFKIPASALMNAEIKHKLNLAEKSKRYNVTINKKKMPLFTHSVRSFQKRHNT